MHNANSSTGEDLGVVLPRSAKLAARLNQPPQDLPPIFASVANQRQRVLVLTSAN
jgi:hypothetical protein